MKKQIKNEILSKHVHISTWIYETNIEISTKANNVNPGYRMNQSSIPYGKFWNIIGPGIQHEVQAVMGNHHKHKRFSNEDH